jgi:hypothetical protein
MATDSGTAKAKETSKDNSSVRREVRDNSSSISRDRNISNQKDNSIPVQTQSPSNTGARNLSSIPAQKDNPSSVGRNSSAAPQSNSPSSAPRDSSTATRNSSTSDNPVSVPVNPQDNRLHSDLNNKVANRAYELYQPNGANHGDDLFHWLQAESEISTRIPEIRPTGSSFSVMAPLEGFTSEEISVIVEPNRALILADKTSSRWQRFSGVANLP